VKKTGPSPEQVMSHEGPEATGSAATNEMVCPHCGTKGKVTTRKVASGPSTAGDSLATGILTAGFSLLGTELSRKQTVTQAWCGHCGESWTIA